MSTTKTYLNPDICGLFTGVCVYVCFLGRERARELKRALHFAAVSPKACDGWGWVPGAPSRSPMGGRDPTT